MGEGGHHFFIYPLSVSSTRFSLSSSQCSSSVQRSPPTRSRTDRVQHIQGGRSASPHSSLRRVSVLSRSCPLCHFFSFPPAWSFLLSFPHAMASPECQCSESAERCMPASPHSTTHSPYFHSMPNQPSGMLRDMFLCTHSWEIWPGTVVSLSKAVVLGGMGGSLLKP